MHRREQNNRDEPVATLKGKDERKLLRAVKELFNIKALLVPKTIGEIPKDTYFERELRLGNNKTIFLTDSGLTSFRAVVEILDKNDFFDGLADFSDIWSAWRKSVENWLSNGQQPEDSDEVLNAISEHVAQNIDNHPFAVPLFGIELEGIDSFALGAMTVMRFSEDALDALGVEHKHADIPLFVDQFKNHLWLKGTSRGTPRIAEQRFSAQAALTVGMLAITAASMHEHGANGFRIGTIMTAEEAAGRSVWFSWNDKERSLVSHFASPRGQSLSVNKALGDESDIVRLIYRAFTILQASDRSELEEAIAKAVYWYSDAHRDPVFAMKLVKYWSCVEAFFSFEKESITHSVSAGLASILVFGGFRFVPLSQYKNLKTEIASLYKLRSQSVHRGSYMHTTGLDVAKFSQWVAWMLVSMVELVEQGYTTLKEVKAQTERLDRLAAPQRS